MNFDLASFLLMIAPALLAITLHEAAHAYAARYWGDNTAEKLGRLTLNPLAHIDLFGTVIVPAILIVSGSPFFFGWAKPVPVIGRNLRDARLGWRTISIAGPLANLLMAFAWALLMGLLPVVPASFGEALAGMASFGISFNAFLFVLNMLPILPLDGGRFLDSFLPAKWSAQFQKIEPYGTWIVFIALVAGLLGPLLAYLAEPLINAALFLSLLLGSLLTGVVM